MTEVTVSPRAGLFDRLRGAVQALRGYGFSGSPGPIAPGTPYTQVNDGFISCLWPMNYGQVGYDPTRMGYYDDVAYSCIALYARIIAQLPGYHRRKLDSGEVITIKNDALARVLKKPNPYQTRSDFLYNLVWSKMEAGNGYAVCQRNARFEPTRLDLVNPWVTRPLITGDGDLFYSVGGNPLLDPFLDPDLGTSRFLLPAEDVLNYRTHCPYPMQPTLGESPLVAAAMAIQIHTGAQSGFAAFSANQSKPSGVLTTDAKLTEAQIKTLREAWATASTKAAQGGTPILSNGLKWQQTMMSATDNQTEAQVKQAIAGVARVFGVPLILLNEAIGTHVTVQTTEQLMTTWMRQGLAYELDAIELEYDQLFGNDYNDDYTEFDVDELLRPDWAARIAGLVQGVQGAVYSPNEARAREGLPPVEDGDMPRVQQQLVPLDWTQFQTDDTTGADNDDGSGGDGTGEGTGDGTGGDGTGGGAGTGEDPVPDPGTADPAGKDIAVFLLERAIKKVRHGQDAN
jgi:HK97 family phage portal protein